MPTIPLVGIGNENSQKYDFVTKKEALIQTKGAHWQRSIKV